MVEEKIKPFRIAYKFLGLIFPILYIFFSGAFVLIFILVILAFYITIDELRMTNRKVNKFLLKNFSFIIKEKEKKKPMTARWLILGSFFAILFFSKEIAVTCLFMFVVGDTMAGVVGKKLRKIKIYDKSLEGHVACFISAFIIALIIVYLLNFNLSINKILLGVLFLTLGQVFPIKIDDNLTMPLAAGIIMSIL